jgi:hypothetical protein
MFAASRTSRMSRASRPASTSTTRAPTTSRSAASPPPAAPAPPASTSTTRRFRCARWPSIPTKPCRSPSTSIASKCCAARRALCSAPAPRAARCATSRPSPALTNSFYSRDEVSYTEGRGAELRSRHRGGMPLIDGTLGARVTVWYRYDGGWIDRIDPVSLETEQKNANYDPDQAVSARGRLGASDQWKVTPSFYYQDRYRERCENYWGLYSNPSNNQLRRRQSDAAHRSGHLLYSRPEDRRRSGVSPKLISNTSYFTARRKPATTARFITSASIRAAEADFAEGGGGDPPAGPVRRELSAARWQRLHLPAGATNYRLAGLDRQRPAELHSGSSGCNRTIRPRR